MVDSLRGLSLDTLRVERYELPLFRKLFPLEAGVFRGENCIHSTGGFKPPRMTGFYPVVPPRRVAPCLLSGQETLASLHNAALRQPMSTCLNVTFTAETLNPAW